MKIQTINDAIDADLRRANLEASAWRYFDAARPAPQKRNPYEPRFPWWAVGLIAFSMAGFIVMFGR